MAELVLLDLDRNWFLCANKAAEAGNQDALDDIKSIWSPYEGVEISCFLCDAVCSEQFPPFAQIVPVYNSPTRLLAIPCCTSCARLPSQVRMGRLLRLLKRMWSERYGKNVTFHTNQRFGQPHPT